MENKMTNLMALNIVLDTCELADDVKEKITNIRNSYAKKSASDRKPSKAEIEKQTTNETLKLAILEFMEEGKTYQVADLIKNCETLNGYTNQKISALVRQLVALGSLNKEEKNRKSFYSLA